MSSTCSACHTLYGAGGKIGPDLTGSNRANLDYILTEIVNPSEVMQEGYHLVTIGTRDGRTLAGNVEGAAPAHLEVRQGAVDATIAERRAIADRYRAGFAGSAVVMPAEPAHILKLYGADDEADPVKAAFARNCILARRLVDPTFVYVLEGRRTIRQVIERWAPAGQTAGSGRWTGDAAIFCSAPPPASAVPSRAGGWDCETVRVSAAGAAGGSR